MRRLETVVLEHVTRAGRHYDWLFERPDATGPGAALVCFRMDRPLWAWAEAGWAVRLERLADHRRRYLRAQGPISGGRGRVRRVDGGTLLAWRWSAADGLAEVDAARFAGLVALRRVGGSRWVGRVLRTPAAGGIICPSGPPTPLG